MCPSFPFGIEDGMWNVIVLIPDLLRKKLYLKYITNYRAIRTRNENAVHVPLLPQCFGGHTYNLVFWIESELEYDDHIYD